jgi:uncharacterized protein (TIGR02996 family)
MTDAAAFLAAIVAAPDADGPRLVYADWLEERGDAARAEFIRVQCALAQVDEDNRDVHPLAGRERELLRAHEEEWTWPVISLWRTRRRKVWDAWRGWLRPFGPRRRPLPPRGRFRRGFVEWLASDLTSYLDRSETLARMTPLREVRAYLAGLDHAKAISRLANCPHVQGLRSLGLRFNFLSAREVRRLAHSRHLEGLRELGLNGLLDRDGVMALATSPLAPQLERLDLSETGTYVETDVSPLLEAAACRRLRSLTLCNVGLRGDALRHVPLWPHFPDLARIDLSRNALGDEYLSAFLESPPPALNRLNLSHTEMNDRAAIELAMWPRLYQLQRLDLSGNHLTDIGVLALADSPHWVGNTRVVLSDNPISPRVVNALRVRLGGWVQV